MTTDTRPDIKDFTTTNEKGVEVTDYSAYKLAVVKSIDVTTLETRVLPISTRVIPARIGVTKFTQRKTYDGQYEYVLVVTIDGKHVGDAVDEGNGGGIYLRANSAADRKAVEAVMDEYAALLVAHWKTTPEEFGFALSSEETLWNHLVEESTLTKDFKRIVKADKKTICLPIEWNGSPLRADSEFGLSFWDDVSYVTLSAPLAVVQKDAEKVKTQAKVSHVWDGTGWVAL